MKIYLAGAFTGWRDDVIFSLNAYDIEFYDPRKDTDQSSIQAFTGEDKEGVTGSDAVLAFDIQGHENIGMAWEVGIAVQAGVPVILVAEVDFVFPLLAGSALRIFTKMPPALNYFGTWARTGDELQAAYGALQASSKPRDK
jgi:hypothetical protein